jgi:hypothetical protein
MRSRIAKVSVRVLSFALPLFLATALASKGVEPYSVRPKIEEMEPLKSEIPNELFPDWSRFKKASLSLIAEIGAIYPDHDVYFFARDAEYLYDLARLLEANGIQIGFRPKLVVVSSDMVRSPDLKRYLIQEGMDESLRNGRDILLVDSGIRGSVLSQVEELMGKPPGWKKLANRGTIRKQLIFSVTRPIPSSGTFLSYFGVDLPSTGIQSEDARQVIGRIEGFAHFTAAATHFEKEGNRLVPVSEISADASVRHRAQTLMSDLIQYSRALSIQTEFTELRQAMKTVAEQVTGAIEFDEQSLQKAFTVLARNKLDRFFHEDLDSITQRNGFKFLNRNRVLEIRQRVICRDFLRPNHSITAP